MQRFHTKIVRLIPLLILALVITGCTRSRPETENGAGAPGTPPLSEDLPSSDQEGAPTKIAILPTATPTRVVSDTETNAGDATSGGAPIEPTATPLTVPTPTSEPVTSIPKPPRTSSDQVTIHIVQPGDNLFRISLKYQVSVNTLVTFNGIANQDKIYVGQRIKIPGAAPIHSGKIHIVQPGDTLIAIALRYNTTTQALITANDLANPNLIYRGQRLVVP